MPLYSAAPVPTPAVFLKEVYVPWLRFKTVTKNFPHLGNSAVALASPFLITQLYVLNPKYW